MSDRLTAYVSARLAAHLRGRGRVDRPASIQGQAVVLFTDISGFSRLTERLVAEASPPERIGDILNAALGSVIRALTEGGADIATFAGDAVLATWPVRPETGSEVLASLKAAAQALAAVDTGDGQALRLRAGVSQGLIVQSIVGGALGDDAADRLWHHVTAGPAVRAATKAASAAAPGQLIADSSVLERFASRAIEGDSGWTVDFIDAPSLPPGPDRRAGDGDAAAAQAPPGVADFVPAAVREAIAGARSAWLAELRPVTVAFIRLDAHADRMDLTALHEDLARCGDIVSSHGGTVARVLYDDKGLVAIARWTGSHASKEVAAAAVTAALALTDRVTDVSIGLATGMAFMGSLGTSERSDFTTIGHAVNRAARLMQVAQNEILCDGGIRSATAERFTFVGRGVMPLKGMDDPVAFYVPLGERSVDGSGGRPIVGRQAELRSLIDPLADLQREGRGSVATIKGEAGIGKTRLLQAAIDRARSMGLRALTLTASELSRSTPYSAWRPAFRALLGFDVHTPASEVTDRVHQVLGTQAEPMIPLILSALGIGSAATGEGDADTTRSVLAQLFDAVVGEGATVIALEDAQWMDSASLALAEHLFRNRQGTGLVALSRPGPQVAQWAEFVAAAPGPRIELTELGDADIAAIACQLLEVDFLPPQLGDLIHQKAEGHPLFAEELVQSLRDQGVVRIDRMERRLDIDPVALKSFAPPATLRDTVATRLDQLSGDELLTLKVASVIGKVFTAEAVAAVDPTEPDYDAVARRLDRVVEAEIIGATHEGYAFKHAILRDVTYDLIPGDQRKEFHARAAAWLDGNSGEGDMFALAEHWRHADRPERAVTAFERAGDLSLGTGSYPEAAAIFSETLAVAPAGVAATDRARWLRKQAVSHRGLGDLTRSHELLIESLAALDIRMPRGSRLAIGLLGQALIQMAHRLGIVRRSPDRQAIELEKAEIFFALGSTTFANLDPLALFYAGLSAANAADRTEPTGVRALSQSFLMYVSGVLGLSGTSARYHARAEEVASHSADSSVLAEVLYNRAGYLGTVGAWEEAAALNERALEMYSRRGNHRGIRSIRSLQSYHAHLRGLIDEEERGYREVAELAGRFDDALSSLLAAAWLGEVALRRGRPDLALTITAPHLGSHRAIGDRAASLKLLGVQALALHRSGAHTEGRALAHECLDLIRQAGAFAAPYAYDGYLLSARYWIESESHPRAELATVARAFRNLRRGLTIAAPAAAWVAGHRALLHGSRRRARRAFDKARRMAIDAGMPFEAALATSDRAALGEGEDRRRLLEQAHDLFTSSGSSHHREETIRALRAS